MNATKTDQSISFFIWNTHWFKTSFWDLYAFIFSSFFFKFLFFHEPKYKQIFSSRVHLYTHIYVTTKMRKRSCCFKNRFKLILRYYKIYLVMYLSPVQMFAQFSHQNLCSFRLIVLLVSHLSDLNVCVYKKCSGGMSKM